MSDCDSTSYLNRINIWSRIDAANDSQYN